MKVLLIAQINSIFTYELVSNIKQKNNNICFNIYSPNPDKNPEKHTKLFEKIFSPKHKFHQIRILKTILNVISLFIFIFKTKKKYDYIHVLFVDYLTYFNIFFFKRISKNTIITIYGSDFYKLNKLQKIFFRKAIKISDNVTCTNDDINSKISLKLKKTNVKTIRFGLTPLQYINKFLKKEISLNFEEIKDKFVIICGYNGYRNNNHIQVIEALNKIKKHLPKNYIIVFQMTYGIDLNYTLKIKKLLKEYCLKYMFINDFLSYERLSSLRICSNLAILPLETDSFSGTVQEYLYTENVLISGSWLPYDLFKKKGVYYETIDNFEDLPEKIKYCINNYDMLKEKTKINKQIIWKLSSWDSNIDNWINLYK